MLTESSPTSLRRFKAELMQLYLYDLNGETGDRLNICRLTTCYEECVPQCEVQTQTQATLGGIYNSHPALLQFCVPSAVYNYTRKKRYLLALEQLDYLQSQPAGGLAVLHKGPLAQDSQCTPNPFGKQSRQISRRNF